MGKTALVLDTRKPLFDEALARLGDVAVVRVRESGDGAIAFAPEPASLAAIDLIMARAPFTHVLATSESNLAFAGFLRSRYGLPGMRYDQALECTNKRRMRQRLASVAPAVGSWLSGEFVAAARRGGALPAEVVVKPLDGSSSRGVRRMPTVAALPYLESEARELLLVEEAVRLDAELHCDGVILGGELRAAFASTYDRPVLAAVGTTRASIHLPHDDPRRAPALAKAAAALAALGVRDAVFHIELLASGGALFIGEVALRPAGGGVARSLALRFGVDLWDAFVKLQLGAPVDVAAAPRAVGFSGVIGVVGDATGPPAASPGIDLIEPLRERVRRGVTAIGSCDFSHHVYFQAADAHALGALLERFTGAAGAR
ncbi:hypothetical protein WMF11_10265 [Sorangium sp. So ce295]|uniref:ATP-grasp domain-containing protein n=1 Tax=Sorangium sp. So ce295 TaxID=3133295 RepID=UPI003F5E2EF6